MVYSKHKFDRTGRLVRGETVSFRSGTTLGYIKNRAFANLRLAESTETCLNIPLFELLDCVLLIHDNLSGLMFVRYTIPEAPKRLGGEI